jgi:hypothetical protein
VRSFKFCTRHQADQIKKNEVGGTCGTHERGEKSVQRFGGKIRRRQLGILRRRWEDGFRMYLREIGWGCRLDPVGSG